MFRPRADCGMLQEFVASGSPVDDLCSISEGHRYAAQTPSASSSKDAAIVSPGALSAD